MQRAVSKFVTGEDLVINYLATDLETADRITHVVKMTNNDVRKLQVSGFYKDVELPGSDINVSDVQEKVNELEGVEQEYANDDTAHEILEMHINADIPGFENENGIKLPYIVTLDRYSGIILSIKRNWSQQDQNNKKIS